MAELKPTCARCGVFIDAGQHCETCTQRQWDAQLGQLDRARARRTRGAWIAFVLVVVIPVVAMIVSALQVAFISKR